MNVARPVAITTPTSAPGISFSASGLYRFHNSSEIIVIIPITAAM